MFQLFFNGGGCFLKNKQIYKKFHGYTYYRYGF